MDWIAVFVRMCMDPGCLLSHLAVAWSLFSGKCLKPLICQHRLVTLLLDNVLLFGFVCAFHKNGSLIHVDVCVKQGLHHTNFFCPLHVH